MFELVTAGAMILLYAGSTIAWAQERDRSKIADKYKWNLTDIYSSDEAWRQAKEKFAAEFPRVEKFKGTLGKSAQNLLQCMESLDLLGKEYARLAIYASFASDIDTRDSKYLGMRQEISQVGSAFGASASFVQPEILTIDAAVLESFYIREKKLEIYRHKLSDLLRTKQHTGTEGEEKILADASLVTGAAAGIYSIFTDAEFPYEKITLSDGKTVLIDRIGFNLYRTSDNREDRKKVFDVYFAKINDFRRTFGTQLYEQVKSDMFTMKARKYESSLQSALDGDNIPLDVYRSLIKNVNANLETFHRYLALRKRMLGVAELHYYDLYVPLVSKVNAKFSVDEAEANVLASLTPLGNEYAAVTKKAFSERWVDMYPTEGKRNGAYSQGGLYDVHPYMLMNYNGKYDDMATLAHELGHTMHSYFSTKKQPFTNAGYPIFLAEVASTFNEALLNDYMLKKIKDDDERLAILGNYLDAVKGTLFRQVQFAEFELAIHELAEKGEALTGDKLNALYLEITRKYYGHDKGVCIVDNPIQSEWAVVPHFYRTFYVYQYSTGLIASSALSEKVMAGDKPATERYLNFLSMGGSDYPITLLQNAGVDLTSPEPFQLTMKKVNRAIDEMEKILNKRK
ncbi:MAG: oligoendopeptidase F [Ignavibacteriales bacterium]|nr:oligoendopeptidase F [Ignavibacteriales bacterium]